MVVFDNVFAYSLAGGDASAAGAGGGASTALANNLVAYWKMDETTGDRMDSHGSNTLAENGTVQAPTGKINLGMKPNGTNNYLSRPTSVELNGDQSFSFSFWFNAEAGTQKSILGKFSNGVSGSYAVRVNSGKITFTYYQGASGFKADAIDPNSIVNNQFYHVVCTHDLVTKTISLSVNDGTPITNTYTFTPVSTSMDFQVGRLGGEITSLLVVDELAFWSDRVLSAADITALYNGGAGLSYDNF